MQGDEGQGGQGLGGNQGTVVAQQPQAVVQQPQAVVQPQQPQVVVQQIQQAQPQVLVVHSHRAVPWENGLCESCGPSGIGFCKL